MIKLDTKKKTATAAAETAAPKKFDKSKLTRNLNRGSILVPHLEKVFQTFDEPWRFDYEEKGHDDAWHPSGDCIPPPSALYAKAQSTEREPISGALRKTFMVGHFWHQLLQHIVLRKLEFCEPTAIEARGQTVWGYPKFAECTMGCTGGHSEHCEAWRPVGPRPYHWATGQGDIAPLVTGKWEGVVDFKTMSSQQFKQPGIPEWAAAKYTAQINIYMDFFDLEQGLILAVNKDSPHEFKEFPFVRDQVLIDAIYQKWEFVGECLAQGHEPTPEDDAAFALTIK